MTTETPTAAVNEPMPLADVDLADLDRSSTAHAWRQFDTLRREDPVHWNPEDGAQLRLLVGDPARGHRRASTATPRPSPRPSSSTSRRSTTTRSRSAARCWRPDGVRHRALRRLLPARLRRRALAQYEDFLRGLTASDAGRGAAPRASSTSSRRSAPTSRSSVLARLLDVPPEDTGQLIAWGNRIIGNTDPDYADVLLDSAESEQYQHLPFRSPAVAGGVRVRPRAGPASGAAATATTWSASWSTACPRTACR